MAGWEAQISDSQMLNNVLIRQDKLFVPQGDNHLYVTSSLSGDNHLYVTSL